eukprot:3249628-Pyramimonas_sp.AAC.1
MRYADDLLLYATIVGDAMFMLEILREQLSRCGLALHASKTKVFTNDPRYSMAADALTVPFGEQTRNA